MSRYIDADRLIKQLYDDDCDIRSIFRVYDMVAIIDDTQTADVVEVRHGKWKMVRMPYGGIDAFCSYCNGNIWSEREWIDMSEEFKRFCPHCGAIMEGEFNV